MKENPPNINGAEGTELTLNFHVTRKYGYYGYKVMVPLYLLVASSLTVFTIDPQHSLERKEMANNMIMAACGLLFVVANELPRLDFLTAIDQVVLSSMITIVIESFAVTIAGVWCTGKAHIQGVGPEHDDSYIGPSGECTGYSTALLADKIIGIGTTAAFILFQLYVLVPTYRRRNKACLLLVGLNEDGSMESQAKRKLLAKLCPELLGSLLHFGDKRDFSEPYRHADGFFQRGRNAPNLPGATAPPAYGSVAWVKLQNAKKSDANPANSGEVPLQIMPPAAQARQHPKPAEATLATSQP